MKRSKQNKPFIARFCLHITGLLLCILPPLICTLSFFPLWKYSYGKTLAGGTLLLILLSALPLFKLIKKRLSSPAGYTVWLILFVVFLLVSKIADEMIVISFYGLTGNILGAICFAISEKREDKNEK